MFYLTDFCRVCLQGEKSLKDIMKDKEAHDSLFNKLKLCVSEVDWCVDKALFMCQGCITKLNTAFEFKCQCVKATETLKNFINHLNNQEPKSDSKDSANVTRTEVRAETLEEYLKQQKEKPEEQKPPPFIRFRPDQQIFTPGQLQNVILSSNTTQSAFPNLFVNLIPTSLLKYPTPPSLSYINRPPTAKNVAQVKDTNQNMFVSINNTLHRLYPVISQTKESVPNQNPTPSKTEPVKPSVSITRDVNQLLNESKSEELSIEIDPSYFDLEEENLSSPKKTDENILKDWEDVIISNKISSDNSSLCNTKTNSNNSLPMLNKMLEVNNGFTPPDIGLLPKESNGVQYISNDVSALTKKPTVCNYVPLQPKIPDNLLGTDFEEKMEFFNAGHFLTPREPDKSTEGNKTFSCELCIHTAESLRMLNSHIKQFHLGKFPYKCKHCSSEFAIRSHFKEHLQAHLADPYDSFSKDTITLEDLNSEPPDSPIFNLYKPPPPPKSEHTEDGENEVVGDFKCDVCPRSFNSAHGLSRHKVRKHNFQNKKKYFVKGMKNAKCDICNREFSTQSYLQLHIKLHYRKSDFRRKVFRKEAYAKHEEMETVTDSDIIENNLSNHLMDIDRRDMDTEDKHSLEMTSENANLESSLETTDMETSEYNIDMSDCNLETAALDSTSTETANSGIDTTADETMDVMDTPTDSTDFVEEASTTIGDSNAVESEKNVDNDSKMQVLDAEDVKIEKLGVQDCNPPEESKSETVESVEKDKKSENHLESKTVESRPALNEDITISSTGIKLKINLRNIKQSSREDTVENKDEIEEIKEDPERNCSQESNKKEKEEEQGKEESNQEKTDSLNDKENLSKESAEAPCADQVNTDQETSVEETLTPIADLLENVILAEDSNMNEAENEASLETQTHFSGYKIEMVNGKPKCNFCSKLFSRKHDLKRHMNNIHLKAIQYKCHLCDGTFYEAFHLTRHLRQHNCFISCTICTKSFSALRDLKYHVETTHEDSATAQCGTCGIIFTKMKQLKDHIQEHDRAIIYKCHLCGEDFGESRELTKHLVGHSGMYSCSVCQATFATEHELNIHFKVHSANVVEGKKYECEICHNKYKKKRYLTSHVKHYHSTEKKPTDVHINRVERNNSDDST